MERVLFAPRALPALPPDVAADPGPYATWLRRRLADRVREFSEQPGEPLHLLMPIVGEPPQETVATLRGLQDQLSGRWTLTVVLESTHQAAFTALLIVSGLQHSNRRLRIIGAESSALGQQITAGIAACRGSSLALILPGDVWAPDSVAQLLRVLAPDTAVYGDEDELTAAGEHLAPLLKPAYSPDFLLSSPYVGRPLALGARVVDRIADSATGAPIVNEHDLALRVCEMAERVDHVGEVLCHRIQMAADPQPTEFDHGHIAAALRRRRESASVQPGPVPGTYYVDRRSERRCTASIIIPFRDEPRFLRSCVESIDATNEGQPIEMVLIDNGSVQPETATLLERLADRPDVVLLSDDRPFNWAALNNAGAKRSTGDVLVFLNNDIEARHPGWLTTLCAHARRDSVGAVGARLLYPDGRLQHCGVVIGLGGAAGHILVGLEPDQTGYLHMAALTRECAAVTGACLATRREVFDALAGFDEALGVDLNDIDYCLRAQLKGWRVLVEPSVELTHHESPSRGTAGDTRDIVHFIDRWQASIEARDPYLNENLTRVDSSCRLRGPDEEEWWHQWRRNLTAT